ncbi:MAG: protein-L-isoaspartate(D-aspartate) O-methyltransferase [Casimicrobiaceae bacterium]|nr:protein-L-isoaspartate(D-aspartate) O-methyltransferase [Casimicrobiaceae bacterium]
MSRGLDLADAGLGMTSERARRRMVERLRQQGIGHEAVLAAMLAVPRHRFVEPALASRAYDDTALPIGFGQTISQPYVVARSLELALGERSRVDLALEIGTGWGYQAAVLAALAREVYTIERISALALRARQILAACGINNVKVRIADGREAASSVAQFDVIVVAAAAAEIPANLPPLLAEGGRLVMPVGSESAQRLVCLERRGTEWVRSEHEAVVFVPLRSGQE